MDAGARTAGRGRDIEEGRWALGWPGGLRRRPRLKRVCVCETRVRRGFIPPCLAVAWRRNAAVSKRRQMSVARQHQVSAQFYDSRLRCGAIVHHLACHSMVSERQRHSLRPRERRGRHLAAGPAGPRIPLVRDTRPAAGPRSRVPTNETAAGLWSRDGCATNCDL